MNPPGIMPSEKPAADSSPRTPPLIVVVGSVALDSVKTPEGASREALGGSAVFFSLSARLFAPVSVVGVVGTDFPPGHRAMLEARGIDTGGIETVEGLTFRWEGRYGRDLNSAKTIDTQLNVFKEFRPRLSERQRAAPVLFLANIDPDLQMDVLSQMDAPRLVACDSMNYWISLKRPALKKLLKRVDVFLVNEGEARKLSREASSVKAASRLCEWGPKVVVVKKGEHGALLAAGGRRYVFPAYPVEDVRDPTGAGDTFAGGFLGSLAASGADLSDAGALKRAVLSGSVMASFDVQRFSTQALEELDRGAVDARFKDFMALLSVPPAQPAA